MAFRDNPVFCGFHGGKLGRVPAGKVKGFFRVNNNAFGFRTGACADCCPAGAVIRPAVGVVSVFVNGDRAFSEK
jgi:hypothetical protein